MSLQVWLPLDGRLVDNGALGSEFDLSGQVSVVESGKTSSTCYHNASITGGYIISKDKVNLGSKQSMCCWVNFDEFNSSASLTGIGGQHRYNSLFGMSLGAKYVTSSTGRLSVSTANASGRTYKDYYGSSILSSGKWYHVCYTYDGSTIRLYVDGKLDGTYSYSGQKVQSDYIQVFGWSLVGNDSNTVYANYHLKGHVNDFRVYDHCLSSKEVNEISRGLVLHYKLDSIGGHNGCPNLVYAGQTAVPNFGGTAGNTILSVSYGTSAKLTCTTLGNSGGRYGRPIGALTVGTTYTWSCDIRTSETVNWTSNNARIGHEQGGMKYNMTTTTEWQRMTHTFTAANTSNNAFVVYPSGVLPVNAYVEIKNLKIEEGSVATEWCPNTGDTEYRDWSSDKTVYDSSGFENNGEFKKNCISIASYSPKYDRCAAMYCNGNEVITTKVPPFKKGSYISGVTESVWIKVSKNSDSDTQYIVNGYPIAIYYSQSEKLMKISKMSSSTTSNYYQASINEDEWHHYVISLKDGVYKIYVDGVRKITWSVNTIYVPNITSVIGHLYFNGEISDFRLYSIGLSDEEVKSLYDTRASIDDSGKMFSGEFNENDGNIKINGNYVTNGKGFNEIPVRFDPNIYTEPDGSMWVRVVRQNNPSSTSNLFSTSDPIETKSVYKNDSTWFDRDVFNYIVTIGALDECELMIKQKATSSSSETKYRWVQYKNPIIATYDWVTPNEIVKNTSSGYSSPSTSYGGLYAHKTSSSFIDACNGNTGNTWGRFGQYQQFQSGLAGYNATTITTGYSDLYIRVDRYGDVATSGLVFRPTANDICSFSKGGVVLASGFVEN